MPQIRMLPVTTVFRHVLGAVILALAVLLASAPASAGPLEEAKAAGLVGEKPDGFVAAVPANPPANIVALVNDINARRRAAYEQIAAKNNTSVAAVGQVTAQKLYNEAPRGTYLMIDGRWVQK